jgi:hypothetical protein
MQARELAASTVLLTPIGNASTLRSMPPMLGTAPMASGNDATARGSSLATGSAHLEAERAVQPSLM